MKWSSGRRTFSPSSARVAMITFYCCPCYVLVIVICVFGDHRVKPFHNTKLINPIMTEKICGAIAEHQSIRPSMATAVQI